MFSIFTTITHLIQRYPSTQPWVQIRIIRPTPDQLNQNRVEWSGQCRDNPDIQPELRTTYLTLNTPFSYLSSICLTSIFFSCSILEHQASFHKFDTFLGMSIQEYVLSK